MSNRSSRSASTGARRVAVVVAVFAALAAGAWAVFFHLPRERVVGTPGVGSDSAPAAGAAAGRAASPSPAAGAAAAASPRALRSLDGGSAVPALAGGGPKSAASRRRSPLERSPGYFPPDDPESMSVVTGRRDAPLVDLEFRGGGTSARDLAVRLLSALHARDENALHALRMTREEFEGVVWPELPESRPITNIAAADAWEMSLTRSLSSAGRAIGSYGGRALEFLRVEASAVAPYRNFTLHRGITITARDTASGEVFAMTFASSFVERRGRFKVVLYRD